MISTKLLFDKCIVLPSLTSDESRILANLLNVFFDDLFIGHKQYYPHLWYSNNKVARITYNDTFVQDCCIVGTLAEIIRLLSDPTVNVTVNPGMTYKASELLKEFC
jgi:hypothetical protein